MTCYYYDYIYICWLAAKLEFFFVLLIFLMSSRFISADINNELVLLHIWLWWMTYSFCDLLTAQPCQVSFRIQSFIVLWTSVKWAFDGKAAVDECMQEHHKMTRGKIHYTDITRQNFVSIFFFENTRVPQGRHCILLWQAL